VYQRVHRSIGEQAGQSCQPLPECAGNYLLAARMRSRTA
jgi:hypothetical protein